MCATILRKSMRVILGIIHKTRPIGARGKFFFKKFFRVRSVIRNKTGKYSLCIFTTHFRAVKQSLSKARYITQMRKSVFVDFIQQNHRFRSFDNCFSV